jgi:hypothetical protein
MARRRRRISIRAERTCARERNCRCSLCPAKVIGYGYGLLFSVRVSRSSKKGKRVTIKDDFVRTLLGSPCNKISFRVCHCGIHRHDFASIAHKVASGQIQIVQRRSLPSADAEYSVDHATFFVGPSISADLIIHESTHAIQDMHRKPVEFYDSEAVAYIAQTMYILLRMGPRSAPRNISHGNAERFAWGNLWACMGNRSRCTEATGNAAAIVALSLIRGHQPATSDLQLLRSALQFNPKYSMGGGTQFNGFRRDRFLTAAELNTIGGTLIR